MATGAVQKGQRVVNSLERGFDPLRPWQGGGGGGDEREWAEVKASMVPSEIVWWWLRTAESPNLRIAETPNLRVTGYLSHRTYEAPKVVQKAPEIVLRQAAGLKVMWASSRGCEVARGCWGGKIEGQGCPRVGIDTVAVFTAYGYGYTAPVAVPYDRRRDCLTLKRGSRSAGNFPGSTGVVMKPQGGPLRGVWAAKTEWVSQLTEYLISGKCAEPAMLIRPYTRTVPVTVTVPARTTFSDPTYGYGYGKSRTRMAP
ncbi:hypothetical protein GGX14DRAFT_384119 [Mycena pura]|uniref:Uncharacterized protein n=1 Tax=Mycena pura TaxID=153505 RepID=A0AAD6YUN9_9AGAR|nr:hypothetical protein GGX14DRAFT_384119 [Mycena pura]